MSASPPSSPETSAAHLPREKPASSAACRVRAARSGIHGWGVYAREPIADGTRIIEYRGEIITKAEAKRREVERLVRQRKGGDASVYIFNLNRRHDLDGRTRKNLARLINHSCAPNCRAETIRGRVWIIARREIPTGAELTFDYGFSFTEWPLHPCRCGAARCPGFIVSSAQRWRLRRIPRTERARVASAFAHSATTPI
jgi:SET domain-containing protein